MNLFTVLLSYFKMKIIKKFFFMHFNSLHIKDYVFGYHK